MRTLPFAFLLLLGACEPRSSVPDGGADWDPDTALPPGDCPTPEPACTLDGPADLEVGSLFTMDMTDLTPADGVDSVALRIDGDIRSTMGTPCAGASDMTACEAALAALPEQPWAGGLANACALPNVCEADLVVTRGDEVFVVDTREALLEILAAIDTPTEAALATYSIGSSYTGFEVRAVTASAGGYDVLGGYLESDCTPIISRTARVHVDADGTLGTTCDVVTSCYADACI